MFIARTLRFYKRTDVCQAITEQARDKEVSIKYDNYFGKRPEAIFTNGDVLEFAKKKATSFHASEELWTNPLNITTGMGKKEIAELRTGWDLILDIDCPYWQLSKLITHLFIKALQAHGIKAVTVKFSGNKGFHIAVPFESFPETFNNEATKDLFPEAPRRIAHYLLDYLAEHYLEDKGDRLVFDGKYRIAKEKLAKELGKTEQDFTTAEDKEEKAKTILLCYNCGHTEQVEKAETKPCTGCGSIMQIEHGERQDAQPAVFNPLSIIEVDTILIAHRHLYRMPYSFHEKSQLVSVPLSTDNVLTFNKKQAQPEAVNTTIPFLDRAAAERGEATQLLIAAYDYEPRIEDDDLPKKEFEIPSEAIPKEFFPPCILAMLEGMKDGRKRSLFTLINFLKGVGWSHEQIEDELRAWNERNDEQLREVVIKGRLRYEKTKKEAMPPHNCKRYYQDMQVCKPDRICATVKNPLQYAKKRAAMAGGRGEGGRQKLTEEQKAMRKAYRERQKKNT